MILTSNGCWLELCIPFPLLLRTNNMHITVNSCANHIFRYIYRQRPGFQKMEACSLLVNLRERNAELEWAAVSGEDRCVTTLITAAKETSNCPITGVTDYSQLSDYTVRLQLCRLIRAKYCSLYNSRIWENCNCYEYRVTEIHRSQYLG